MQASGRVDFLVCTSSPPQFVRRRAKNLDHLVHRGRSSKPAGPGYLAVATKFCWAEQPPVHVLIAGAPFLSQFSQGHPFPVSTHNTRSADTQSTVPSFRAAGLESWSIASIFEGDFSWAHETSRSSTVFPSFFSTSSESFQQFCKHGRRSNWGSRQKRSSCRRRRPLWQASQRRQPNGLR